MNRKAIFFMILIGVILIGCGKETANRSAHPAVPAEISQINFLIGEWELVTEIITSKGDVYQNTARMTGEYILDGSGIMVTQRHQPMRKDRPVFISCEIYNFDTETQQWSGASVNTLGNRKFYDGKFSNNKLQFLQSGKLFQNETGINRITYSRISDNQFKCTVEHSPDSGETWETPQYSYIATRIQSQKN